MRLLFISTARCCLIAFLAAQTAAAAPIPGLFNTGVDNSGVPLANSTVDPHYRLVQSADGSAPGPNAFVVIDTLFPIVSGPWMPSSSLSKWIGPMANQSGGNLPGSYRYRITFNLAGLEPSTAVITGRWSSDNEGLGIFLNGMATGFSYDGNFGAFSAPFTINSGFLDGTNTLDFVVNNGGAGVNPTAFRAEISGTADVEAPPGTPPTIVTSPQSQNVGLGESLQLTVSATGSRPFTYQWRFNGGAISGATNASYTIATAASANAGNYDAIVSNGFGAPTSGVAVVNVVFLSAAQRSYEPAGPSSRRTGLAITEIMYHPTNRMDLKNGEFIELYNSNPYAEDLSGYRLTGAVDYMFAHGTTIASNGYLVIATVPADAQAIYGISGVLGGFTNNLPNDSGTIRLRKKSGGIVLEVNYSDQPPWPAAADGTGHSLVLARPTYGENSAKSWAASNVKGGSPGAADPVPTGSLENVVINEILAHTDPPLMDYIELHNHSSLAVDLSGAWLSDEAKTNKFSIPPGTVLPPGGFVAFDETQLGFSLSADGETIYFSNPAQTRVLDVLRFGGQANGVASGRRPDGEGPFRELAARTPGTNNAALLTRSVVINEIMYHPISEDGDDQFVELLNRGGTPANIGGWRFTAGIDFTFPVGWTIPAGGYCVVAKNAARMMSNYPGVLNPANLIGSFNGSLSDGGERLALAMPDTIVTPATNGMLASTNRFYIVMNEVTYGDGGRWGKWSDGGGSSLELVDAHSDNRHAPNWADSDESAKSQWTTVEHTGVLDFGHPAVTTINELHFFLMDAGEAMVDDLEVISGGVNRVSNPGFESGATGYIFRGTQRPSFATNGGFSGVNGLRLVATARGDVVNRVQTTLTVAPGAGSTATLRAKARWLRGHPELLLRLVGNSLEAVGTLPVPRNLGTPGAVNSRARANAGPAITEVTHRPVLPQAGQSVRVTARVQDVDGVQGVTLLYRVDPSATLNSVAMNDGGVNGDLLAGDGIYTGLLPGQSAGVIAAFRVQATDSFTPTATTQFPEDAPTRECLVRFGETVPTGGFATYRIWMTQATFNFWSSREQSANEDLDVTFVYGDSRVVYGVGAHYGASENYSTILNTPTGTLVGYNMTFPEDDLFLGADGVRLDWPNRDTTQLREVTMYWLLEQYGLPNHYRRFIHLHINGIRRGTIYNDTQRPNGDALEEWYPGDSDGELYKLNPWFEANTAGTINPNTWVPPRLTNVTTTGGAIKTAFYRFAWLPRSISGSANNYSNLHAMIAASAAPSNGYPSAIECAVDVPQWMRTFAMNDLASYWDAFGNPNSKNSYLYRPQRSGWKILCWDFDVGLGTGNGQAEELPTAPLFGGTGNDPGLNRMNVTPFIVRHYWAALDEAVYGFFQGSAVTTFLADRHAAFEAAGLGTTSPFVPSGTVPGGEPQRSIPDWITARRNFLLGQLQTVSNVFNVTGTNFIVTSSNLVTLTGTAPVRVQAITINGVAYTPVWTTVNTWRLQVAVPAGFTNLDIAGLDGSGVVFSNRMVTIQFTGADLSPVDNVVINEIMYNPVLPEAGFIELFNRATNSAFDLGGWRINGVDFTFPPGTVLPARSFLVVCKNRAAFGAAYGWGIPASCEYDGELDNGGETLSLIKPGAIPAENILVDRVTYDDDAPWPARADGTGPSLQLIDGAQDNNRVANWSDGAGWRFFSFSASSGPTLATAFALFLANAGELHVDRVSLVQGSTPEAGSNLLANASFENGLTSWLPMGNHIASTVVTGVALDGTNSLRLSATGVGSSTSAAVTQSIAGVVANMPYTVSFWFLPSTSAATGLHFRVTSSLRSMTAIDVRPVLASPGAANTVAGTLTPFPPLWLSEIQPVNFNTLADGFGDFDPWIEIYNSGTNALALDGFSLANSYSNLSQWPFPPGTMIQPGEYLLVWADAEPGETAGTNLHANFTLNPTNGSVALARGGQIVDHLNYSGVGTNGSFGAHPAAQASFRQAFTYATPRGTNDPSSPPVTLWINEWMAANGGAFVDPADLASDDWFEIYNPSASAVDLAGFRLADNVAGSPSHTVLDGTIVPAQGHLLVWADEQSSQTVPGGDLHVNFKLSQAGESIALFDPSGRLIDSITFGMQTNNISQGRWPDGDAALYYFPVTPSPRAANSLPPVLPPTIEILEIEFASGSATLVWSAEDGRIYRVQFKNNLDDAEWADLPGDVPAGGATAMKTDATLGANPHRFYRILFVQ